MPQTDRPAPRPLKMPGNRPWRALFCSLAALTLALALVPGSKTQAATYYVDPSCASGGDGTTTSCGPHGPFTKWSQVTWIPGATYSQRGGTTAYEEVVIGASGEPGKPITLNSYGTGKAILNGAVALAPASWKPDDPATGVYSQVLDRSTLMEDGVYLKNSSTPGCQDGNYYFRWNTPREHYRPTSGTPADHLVEKVSKVGIELGAHSHITIEGLSITRYRYGIKGSLPARNTGNHHLTITGNEISRSEFGIWLYANDATASDNAITHNHIDGSFSGIELGVVAVDSVGTGSHSRTEIAHNTITHCSEVSGAPKGYGWDEVDVSGWDREGIGTQNLVASRIHDNVASGSCRGIDIYVGRGADGSDNEIYGNFIATRLAALYLQPSPPARAFGGNKVYNNILKGGGDDGWYSAAALKNVAHPTAAYNAFYHNTLIPDTNGIWVLGDYWKVENNIVFGGGNVYLITTKPHVSIDYNLYYRGKWDNWHANGTQSNWSAWRGAGFDAHGLHKDPLFLNGSRTLSLPSDFRLKENSPALGAGIDLGLGTDFEGRPRRGRPAIGALEYPGGAGEGASPGGPRR